MANSSRPRKKCTRRSRTPQCHEGSTSNAMVDDVSETSNVPAAEVEPASTPKRRGRGRYMGRVLVKRRRSGGPVPIKADVDNGQVVGDDCQRFASECLNAARRKLPIQVPNFAQLFADIQQSVIPIVRDIFTFIPVEGEELEQMGLEELDLFDSKVDKMIVATSRRRWVDWRSRCHAHYKKYATDEECLANPPPGMELDDWRDLITHFKSKHFQDRSKTNTKNRSNQDNGVISGRTSFRQLSYAQRNASGVEPNIIELWKLSHCKKDVWSTPEAKRIYEEANEKLAQATLAASQSLDGSVPLPTADEIFASIVGTRTGYIRGRGCGPKPPRQTRSSSITSAYVANLEAQFKDTKMELQETKTELAKVQSELSSVKASLDVLINHLGLAPASQ